MMTMMMMRWRRSGIFVAAAAAALLTIAPLISSSEAAFTTTTTTTSTPLRASLLLPPITTTGRRRTAAMTTTLHQSAAAAAAATSTTTTTTTDAHNSNNDNNNNLALHQSELFPRSTDDNADVHSHNVVDAPPLSPIFTSSSGSVDDLELKIAALEHEIAQLQQQQQQQQSALHQPDDEKKKRRNNNNDWKLWYQNEATKNAALLHRQQQRERDTELRMQQLQGQLDMVRQERHVWETLHRQVVTEADAANARLGAVRQRHAEELRNVLEQLDRLIALRSVDQSRAAAELQRVREEGAAQLERVARLAAAELESTVNRYEGKLAVAESNARHARSELQAVEENLQDRRFRVRILEQEQRRLRSLARTAVRLMRDRVVARWVRIRSFRIMPSLSSSSSRREKKQQHRLERTPTKVTVVKKADQKKATVLNDTLLSRQYK